MAREGSPPQLQLFYVTRNGNASRRRAPRVSDSSPTELGAALEPRESARPRRPCVIRCRGGGGGHETRERVRHTLIL